MTVRRTLPQRGRSLIGAWCFVDHYGPDRVADTGGMCGRAAPAHRAADGELALHRRDRAPRHGRPPRDGPPGRGQPDDRRAGDQPLGGLDARHHRAARRPAVGGPAGASRATSSRPSSTTPPTRSTGDGWEARVFLGSLLGVTSPVLDPHTAPRRRAAARRRHHAGPRRRRDLRARPAPRPRGGQPSTARRASPASSSTPRPVATRSPSRPTRTCGRCCSVARRSGSPSSCGGTSWAAPTRRSSPSARSGRRRSTASTTARTSDPDGTASWSATTCPPIPAPALPNARLRERR